MATLLMMEHGTYPSKHIFATLEATTLYNFTVWGRYEKTLHIVLFAVYENFPASFVPHASSTCLSSS